MDRTLPGRGYASAHGATRRRPAPDHDQSPRPRPRRRLRVAARQGRPRGDRLPRGRERPHPASAPRTWRTCARRSSTRSRPAPRRPTCRCRPATAATGTTAAPSRAASTAPAAGSPIGATDDWTPPQPAEDGGPDQPALPGEQLLLDLNELAEGHDFFSLGGSAVSPDAHLLAYSTDTTGDERYTVRVKDLRTGELLDDEITGVLGGVTWTRDGEDLYYTTIDDTWRPDKIWRHRLGTAQADDELVHHEQRRPVLGRRRTQPHRPVPDRSPRAPRSPPSTASSTPTDPRRASGCSPRAARAWSTASSTP